MAATPIQFLESLNANKLWIKREDLIPVSFGGNKARKAMLFFDAIDAGAYDCIVTYGSSSSNHCRVVANLAAMRKIPCYIISPLEASKTTYNSILMKLFDAKIETVPVSAVHDTIERTLSNCRERGFKPYFIAGGGHGNIGTQAYVDCFAEIKEFEEKNGVKFDYIFHASGTGTTQAGLICGQIINNDFEKKIVGISIARKNPRGRNVVLDSVREFLRAKQININDENINNMTIFDDSYTGSGYGEELSSVKNTIDSFIKKYAIPLDMTYTGKAFDGMIRYLSKSNVCNKNVLFIHTGGTPLFFDYLNEKYDV